METDTAPTHTADARRDGQAKRTADDAPAFVDESGDGYGDPRHDDPRNYRNEPPIGVSDANEV